MSLKNKHGIIESDISTYEQEGRPVGINFELKDGTALFAPYGSLSHVLLRDGEITIHYNFGLVRVRGDRLTTIYKLLQANELSSLSCVTDEINKADEPQMKKIIFEDFDTLAN